MNTMGLMHLPVTCSANGKSVEVEILFDSGASYSLLPAEAWHRLGLTPTRAFRLRLVDGTVLERPLSECMLEIEGERSASPVILGNEGNLPLLGAISLETVGLVLDPFTRILHPMRMLVPTLVAVPGGLMSDN